MLQNIFSHRPPFKNLSNKAEITAVPAGCLRDFFLVMLFTDTERILIDNRQKTIFGPLGNECSSCRMHNANNNDETRDNS